MADLILLTDECADLDLAYSDSEEVPAPIHWSSSDDTVVALGERNDDLGTLTVNAVSPGTATLLAEVGNAGGYFSRSLSVEVTPEPDTPPVDPRTLVITVLAVRKK